MGEGGRAQRDRERGLGLQAPPPYSAWTDSCPLAATCPECGLRFEWADLLAESRRTIRWFYEHARRWWDIRRAWGTCFRALAPWSYWREVTVMRRLAPWRAAMHPIVLATSLILLLMILVAAISAWALADGRMGAAAGRSTLLQEASLMSMFLAAMLIQPWIGWLWASGRTPQPLLGCATIAFPAVALLIIAVAPSEWRRARVRFGQLSRVGAALTAPMLAIGLAHVLVIAALVTLRVVGRSLWPQNAFMSNAASWLFVSEPRFDFLFAACILLQAVSLYFALRRSLRLERPWPLWCAATLAGAAAAVNAYYFAWILSIRG